MWAHLGCTADVHPVDLGRSMEKVRIIPNDLEAPTSRAEIGMYKRRCVYSYVFPQKPKIAGEWWWI